MKKKEIENIQTKLIVDILRSDFDKKLFMKAIKKLRKLDKDDFNYAIQTLFEIVQSEKFIWKDGNVKKT